MYGINRFLCPKLKYDGKWLVSLTPHIDLGTSDESKVQPLGQNDWDLLRPAAFEAQVRQERLRVDRYGGGFSVVFFAFNPKTRQRRAINGLGKAIAANIRCTDQVGWVSKATLGVLLRNTPLAEASRFVKRSLAVTGAELFPCSGLVQTYWVADPNERDAASQGLSGIKQRTLVMARLTQRTPGGQTTEYIEEQRQVSGTPPRKEKAPQTEDFPFDLRDLLGWKLPRWKRALDIVGSSLGLLLLLPLFVLISLTIRGVSKGPIFFRQERVGYLGRPFSIWKFRTMAVRPADSEHERHVRTLIRQNEPLQKIDNRLPVIPFGGFLRASAMDELPQLINVFRGEMTLVGPRPDVPYAAAEYHHWHSSRILCVPGMTGLWQVSGKNETTFEEMVRLDLRYLNQMSLALDLQIMLRTLRVVVCSIAAGVGQKPRRQQCSQSAASRNGRLAR